MIQLVSSRKMVRSLEREEGDKTVTREITGSRRKTDEKSKQGRGLDTDPEDECMQ